MVWIVCIIPIRMFANLGFLLGSKWVLRLLSFSWSSRFIFSLLWHPRVWWSALLFFVHSVWLRVWMLLVLVRSLMSLDGTALTLILRIQVVLLVVLVAIRYVAPPPILSLGVAIANNFFDILDSSYDCFQLPFFVWLLDLMYWCYYLDPSYYLFVLLLFILMYTIIL